MLRKYEGNFLFGLFLGTLKLMWGKSQKPVCVVVLVQSAASNSDHQTLKFHLFHVKSAGSQWDNHQRGKHVTQQSNALDAPLLHNHSLFTSPLSDGRGKHVLADSCSPRRWIQLSGNNNLQQPTILITEQQAAGCRRGRRPSAAYYSHCSPDEPASLLRVSELTLQLLVQKLESGLLSLLSWELMGKGNGTFRWSLTV